MAGLKRTIALVGMMGAGKSSIGRRLADHLKVPFSDSDSEVENAAGCPITDIFDQFGEAAFRDGERRVIQRILRKPPHVLATGGGSLLDPGTRALLADLAVSVWLRAPLDLLLRRVGRRDGRPLLKPGSPRDVLERLLAEREPLYAQAQIAIDTEGGPHAVAVDRIVAALRQLNVVCSP